MNKFIKGDPIIPYEHMKQLGKINYMNNVVTPRERASKLAKDMVHAYEVGAAMKDLDAVVHFWISLAERAITAAIEEAKAENAKPGRAVEDDHGARLVVGKPLPFEDPPKCHNCGSVEDVRLGICRRCFVG